MSAATVEELGTDFLLGQMDLDHTQPIEFVILGGLSLTGVVHAIVASKDDLTRPLWFQLRTGEVIPWASVLWMKQAGR